MDPVTIGKARLRERLAQRLHPAEERDERAHGRRAVVGVPPGQGADLHGAREAPLAKQERQRPGRQVDRGLREPAIREAVQGGLLLVAARDGVAGALPVVAILRREIRREHEIDDVGGLRRVRQVAPRLADDAHDLLASRLGRIDGRGEREEEGVESRGVRGVAVRRGPDGKVGDPQGEIGHAGREGAEDLRGELRVDLERVRVQRRLARGRGQHAALHEVARPPVRYPDKIIDVRSPPVPDLLRREAEPPRLGDEVQVDVLDIGVVVGRTGIEQHEIDPRPVAAERLAPVGVGEERARGADALGPQPGPVRDALPDPHRP